MCTYSTSTDIELTSLLKKDDRAAYTEIYDRYIYTLLNHAYNKTRNREEAKDAVHEVFAMLWSNRAKLDNVNNISGYLYTSLRNVILNQVAHKGVESKYMFSLLRFSKEEAETDHRVRENQLSQLIEDEIAALPPKMREVFSLSRKAHLNHKEIAERLQISEQTVSKHITNALKILRLKLGIIAYLILIINSK